MKLDLTEEQDLMRQTAERFLETESPLSAVRDAYDKQFGFERDWWSQASELGWTMLGVPETMGGVSLSGNPIEDSCIIAEELGRRVAPGPFQTTVTSLQALSGSNNAQAQSNLVTEIMAGATIIAWAYGEPGNIWDLPQFKTKITRTAKGWEVSGIKAYVEAGSEADYFVVTGLYEGMPVQLLIPSELPGISTRACRSIDCVRRFAEIRFDRVQIQANAFLEFDDVVGSVNKQMQLAILLQCAETNGAIDKAMQFTMYYMQQRFAFGRAIASYQALKHRLADMLLMLHSSMAITDSAIAALDANYQESEMLAAVAKAYVGSNSSEIMSDLVQMTGGIAVTWEYDLHLYGRRVALNRAVFGTPEFHRFRIQKLLAA